VPIRGDLAGVKMADRANLSSILNPVQLATD
jgi:hypothetical protein